MLKLKANRYKIIVAISLLIGTAIWFWFCLPDPLFKTPTSTILEDSKGELLSARIASDGQWRFPASETIPEKFEKAILTFEDKNFRHHFGVDWLALINAFYQNMKAGKVVRGGSTISMQVIRLSRNNKNRTYWEKAIEIILASRLELTSTKEEILQLYMKEAPFGGNIVGLETASWRYFGRSPEKLSWSETATLAVLPNAPSLIFPGKNQEKLRLKRNRLLKQLSKQKLIDETSYKLAIKEPLPDHVLPIPSNTPHLLIKAEKDGLKGRRNKTSIERKLQHQVNTILKRHQSRLKANGVFNAAALVLDVEKGTVLAYGANVLGEKDESHGYAVDLIHAERSTGSILKPLLFAMMVDEGNYLSHALVADIPTLIDGYAPKNYALTYDGAVEFRSAISRSLNVPAVRLLQEYGIEKFHSNLKRLGMTTLKRPANHYGLSIILGGAEGTLWDLANLYRNMAYNLNYYHAHYGKYPENPFQKASYLRENQLNNPKNSKIYPLSPASIWQTFEAMNEVSRPEEESSWKEFASGYKIAWKTGTSFGNRDGWAIGCTPKYVVAVWTGNADGEGRPDLTGIGAAAPVMFDIFKVLPASPWFMQPFNDMLKIKVCKQTGFKASEDCGETEIKWEAKQGRASPICPYSKTIYLDQTEKFRVNSNCESVSTMKTKSWFVLPPAMDYYYKSKNASYQPLPSFKLGCNASEKQLKSFDIIYPVNNSKIYIPIELDGKPGRTIFEVAHREASMTLFWYLDNHFLGSTKDFHQFALNPESGKHRLTITDEKGESTDVDFEIVSNN
ncbi:MAG TPA: penicillin-binding protein 1C [Cytophagales bacterium]|nr:penicillin-binding protein 1C [Cytophagales bacterium]